MKKLLSETIFSQEIASSRKLHVADVLYLKAANL